MLYRLIREVEFKLGQQFLTEREVSERFGGHALPDQQPDLQVSQHADCFPVPRGQRNAARLGEAPPAQPQLHHERLHGRHLIVRNADPYLYPLVTSAIIFVAVLLDSLRSRLLVRLGRRRIRND